MWNPISGLPGFPVTRAQCNGGAPYWRRAGGDRLRALSAPARGRVGGGLLTRLCCSRGRPGHGAAREDTQGAKVRQAAEVSRGFRVSKPAGLEVLLRPTGPNLSSWAGWASLPQACRCARPCGAWGAGALGSGHGPECSAKAGSPLPARSRQAVRGASANLGCTVTVVPTHSLNEGLRSTPCATAPCQVLFYALAVQ